MGFVRAAGPPLDGPDVITPIEDIGPRSPVPIGVAAPRPFPHAGRPARPPPPRAVGVATVSLTGDGPEASTRVLGASVGKEVLVRGCASRNGENNRYAASFIKLADGTVQRVGQDVEGIFGNKIWR